MNDASRSGRDKAHAAKAYNKAANKAGNAMLGSAKAGSAKAGSAKAGSAKAGSETTPSSKGNTKASTGPKNAETAKSKTSNKNGKTVATKSAGKNGKTAAARPYSRPRGGPAKPIADLVPQVSRTAFRRFGFVQSSVVTRWGEIVGEKYAGLCTPEAIRFPPGEKSDGILQLTVVPAQAAIIQHVIPEIIIRVNRFFGYKAVNQVKLRQGAVHSRSGERKIAAPPSLKPIPMELGDSLRDIGDPELRTVLESLARNLNSKEDQDA